jgi:(1->4)-alpha-D-glucan 1-alpha-D-glucosylmutase
MRSAIPTATYRLQLHKDFTLHDAACHVPYFADLGVSHLYLSPILKARAGSMHGYDVVDHSELNPELGGWPGLLDLAARCHAVGLGLILDIVPNHMAVSGSDNAAWLDVLENGPASPSARMFDIDFASADPARAGKIVVPVLGEPYGKVLAAGTLSLIWDPALGKLAFAYGPHRFPLRPEDYKQVLGEQQPAHANLGRWQQPEHLHELLERQHFYLCWWRAAGDLVNWRRFFDINELASLCVEDEQVFQAVHAITLRLYAEGIIDGVRVDHVDGLTDPAAYTRHLRQEMVARNTHRPIHAPSDGPYIIVEKILGRAEPLAPDWDIDGTTGYDFMDQVSALQHDPAGEETLNILWHSVSGRAQDFDSEESSARQEILCTAFNGQLADCARAFARLAQSDLATRDLTEASFVRALARVVTRLRVYRSYATGARDAPMLGKSFAESLHEARKSLPADEAAFAFLAACLAGRATGSAADHLTAVRRLNQLAAPVAAKAVEDTALYRYSQLISRNDVGFDASRLALDAGQFLISGKARAKAWPRAMLTTATHDHKRGEDVRARLAVLSELPELWRDAVQEWFRITATCRPTQIANDDAYALFQTLVGAWPMELVAQDAAGLAAFNARVAGWRVKSLREAKLRSSWVTPDIAYEEANLAWLENLLDQNKSADFLASMSAFVVRVARAGAVNSIVQAALRCSWPGIPDLYQGAELWDFSLVDPDNRRPVDYYARARLLQAGASDWRSGAAKQVVIARLLSWRRAAPALFLHGDLEPLPVSGRRAAHVLAFQRQAAGSAMKFAAMLHVAQPVLQLGALPDAYWWGDTAVLCGEEWCAAATLFETAPIWGELDGAVASGPWTLSGLQTALA